MGIRDRSDSCRMRLKNAKLGNFQENVRACFPLLDGFALDSDSGNPTIQSCQCSMPRANVGPRESCRADDAVDQVESNRDVDVNSRIECCTGEMHHDGNNEAKEEDDMLNHEELIREVPNRSNRAEIREDEDGIYCPASWDTRISGVLQWTKVVGIP